MGLYNQKISVDLSIQNLQMSLAILAAKIVQLVSFLYKNAVYYTYINSFLFSFLSLQLTFLLVDSQVGLQPADYVAIEMFEEFVKPYAVSFQLLEVYRL